MKVAIVLCAILGLSFGAVLPHGNQQPLVQYHDARNLGDLLKELMNLIPTDKIVQIVLEHVNNDPEVHDAIEYLRSDEFIKIVAKVQSMPEFKEFLKYLYDSGLDIYTYINFVNDIFGYPHVNPMKHKIRPRSIMSMIDEILSVIPLDKIKDFYHNKVENDPDFIALLKRLRSPDFKKIVDAVRNMPEYKDLLNRLKQHGIPVDEIVKKIDDFFGWGRMHQENTRNLNDLFQELMKLIPKDKIIEIFLNHLENDPEVKDAVAYLRSDDFEKIVTTVQNMPEFKEFLKYLYDSGLDIYTYINFVNDLLGLPHVNPPVYKSAAFRPRSIMSMLDEILAVLPLDKIKEFYHNKVENNPDFIALLKRLRSPDFKKIVDAVRNMPEYKDLLNRLKQHGIPVDEIVKKIDDFFGWGRMIHHSTRNLNDLFKELLSMIPLDKVIEILANHLENDPEVKEAFAYLQSDEFQKIIVKVDGSPQFLDVLEFIYKAGIDVYGYINMVHEILHLPPVHRPGTLKSHRQTRTILSMVDEILKVIPVDKMLAFYHEKVENDPQFKQLLEKLKSKEFADMVNAVSSMPEFKDMRQRLKNHGIDVDAIDKEIRHFFGW